MASEIAFQNRSERNLTFIEMLLDFVNQFVSGTLILSFSSKILRSFQQEKNIFPNLVIPSKYILLKFNFMNKK
jgi:hypothetical protein